MPESIPISPNRDGLRLPSLIFCTVSQLPLSIIASWVSLKTSLSSGLFNILTLLLYDFLAVLKFAVWTRYSCLARISARVRSDHAYGFPGGLAGVSIPILRR